MRIGRVLHQRRKLLGVGLIGLLAFAGGCGGGEDAVAPAPVQPEGLAPAAADPAGKGVQNSPRARAKESRAAEKVKK